MKSWTNLRAILREDLRLDHEAQYERPDSTCCLRCCRPHPRGWRRLYKGLRIVSWYALIQLGIAWECRAFRAGYTCEAWTVHRTCPGCGSPRPTA